MPEIRKLPFNKNLNYLFWFCILWEVIQGLMILTQYLNFSLQFPVPSLMPLAYLILLAYYVIRKEVNRWLRKIQNKRRGEIPFWAWWCFTLALFLGESLSCGKYRFPFKALEICVYITVIYAGSCVSKLLLIRRTKEDRRRNRQQSQGDTHHALVAK